MKPPFVLISIIVALLAAACGGPGESEPAAPAATSTAGEGMIEGGSGEQTPIVTSGPSQTTPATPAPAADLPESDYPDIVVTDLAGGMVNLRELALSDQPVLLWFWAPH